VAGGGGAGGCCASTALAQATRQSTRSREVMLSFYLAATAPAPRRGCHRLSIFWRSSRVGTKPRFS
jgi:hypothetical protein